jgi:hypothetical protein
MGTATPMFSDTAHPHNVVQKLDAINKGHYVEFGIIVGFPLILSFAAMAAAGGMGSSVPQEGEGDDGPWWSDIYNL